MKHMMCYLSRGESLNPSPALVLVTAHEIHAYYMIHAYTFTCYGTHLMQCRNHSRVQVQPLASGIVLRNQFISGVMASVYSSSKEKCFSLK